MLFLIFLIVLSSGDCRDQNWRWMPHSTNDESSDSWKDEFNVEVTRDLCYGTRQSAPMNYKNSGNFDYTFEMGNTIDLTCRYSRKGYTLVWQDSNGFLSGSIISDNYVALRLTIKPDEEDIGLMLACHVVQDKSTKKTISITLQSNRVCNEGWGNKIEGDSIFLESGGAYTANKTCNGIAHYPKRPQLDTSKPVYTKTIIQPNGEVINSFSEALIGTKLFCISYQNIETRKKTGIQSRNPLHNVIITYKRVKSKVTFYLKNDTKVITIKEILNDTEKAGGRKPKGPNDTEIADTLSSPVAVVGSVLGTIILVLILVSVSIWFKKIRKRDSDDTARVIYAEIEEKPPLPPPRQNFEPYAKIIGTLEPKNQTQSDEDHLYHIIK